MVSFFFFFFFLVLTEKKDLIADDTRDYKDEEPGPAMKRQPRPTRASIGLEKPDRSVVEDNHSPCLCYSVTKRKE